MLNWFYEYYLSIAAAYDRNQFLGTVIIELSSLFILAPLTARFVIFQQNRKYRMVRRNITRVVLVQYLQYIGGIERICRRLANGKKAPKASDFDAIRELADRSLASIKTTRNTIRDFGTIFSDEFTYWLLHLNLVVQPQRKFREARHKALTMDFERHKREGLDRRRGILSSRYRFIHLKALSAPLSETLLRNRSNFALDDAYFDADSAVEGLFHHEIALIVRLNELLARTVEIEPASYDQCIELMMNNSVFLNSDDFSSLLAKSDIGTKANDELLKAYDELKTKIDQTFRSQRVAKRIAQTG